MKKLIGLLLVICMILGVLVGCSDREDISGEISALENEEKDTSSDSEKENEDEEADDTESVKDESAEEDVQAGSEENAEEDTEEVIEENTEDESEEEQVPESENLISFGRMEGGVYTNTYAGFGCTLDENWVFYSADELQELPQDIVGLYEDTELGEIAAQYAQLYDMMAENTADLTTMNVLYTKIGLQEQILYAMMTEEEAIDLTLSKQDMLVEAYAASGFENIVIEKVNVTFAGEEHVGLKTSCTVQGVAYYILQIIDYSRGSYGVTLSVGSFINDVTDELLAKFYKV